jgi:hypothetical protein
LIGEPRAVIKFVLGIAAFPSSHTLGPVRWKSLRRPTMYLGLIRCLSFDRWSAKEIWATL